MRKHKKLFSIMLGAVMSFSTCIGSITVIQAATTPANGNIYYIKNANSGLYLQVENSSTSNGANVCQATGDGNNGQKWVVNTNSDGSVSLKSALDMTGGLSLDIPNGDANNLTNVQVWESNGLAPQNFKLIDSGNGSYTIATAASGYSRCLDVIDWSKDNGANVMQYDSFTAANQLWYFEEASWPSSNSSSSSSSSSSSTTKASTSTKSWNMGDSALKNLGTLASSTTVDGLQLNATSSKTMSVKAESATVDGNSYKYALALGGTGSTSYRNVAFDVNGTTTIKVTGKSSGSSARTLVVMGDNGKQLGTLTMSSSASLQSVKVNYSGKVYIYSSGSGINIYKVQIDTTGSLPSGDVATEATTAKQTTTKTETTTKKETTTEATTSAPVAASGTKSWNMGNSNLKGLGTISSNITVDGLKLIANSSKTMSVKAESVKVDGNTYSYCLALGGTGSTSYRSIALPISGTSTIKVTAKSSGSSARTLVVMGDNGKQLGTISAPTNAALGSLKVNYNGTVYIYSSGSGINIYKVQLDTTGAIPGGSSSSSSDTTKTQNTTAKQTTTKAETKTEATTKATTTTTKAQNNSSSSNVKLTTPPSKVVKTITANSESELKSAIDTVNKSGGTIYINTKEINVKNPLKLSGSTAGAIVGVKQSDGSYPVINFKGMTSGKRGITVSGSNQLIQNVIIENAADNGIWVSGAKNKIEHVITRYNNDSGIQLSDNANGNTLRYCYSYRNCDIATYGANADGFAPKLGASNTVFEYCYAWDNSDDGWDSFDKQGDKSATVTYSHSACWNNGNTAIYSGAYDKANNFYYGKTDSKLQLQNSSWISKAEGAMNGNGFKFGSKTTEKSTSVIRTADYCVAFDHKSKGFDNNNSEGCTGNITNCVSFQNNINYQLPYKFAKWDNNYSWSAKKSDQSKQSQTLKKPSNTSSATSSFYAVRDNIIKYVYQNKMPDDYGINFDSAIKNLK